MVEGATTLWEAWEGSHTQQASSWNHIMFGGNIHTWVYSTLAGIDTAVNGTSAGWEHINVITPYKGQTRLIVRKLKEVPRPSL